MLMLEMQGYAEQAINKSRFYAWAVPCENERDVAKMLRVMAQQHSTASHLAYAYRVKTPDGIVPRFSDAGEPSGTAGKPILQMLDGRNYVNVCIAVIRYYGGINLGTGGLVRAYGGTAKMALEAAKSAPYIEMQTLKLSVPYQRVDELTRIIGQLKGRIVNKNFDSMAHLQIYLPKQEVPLLLSKFS